MTLTQREEMQKVVRETPSISGFSYPFLRLLVEKAYELEEVGSLATHHDANNEEVTLTGIGAITLGHIAEQVRGGWNNAHNWATGEQVPIRSMTGMLDTADAFLAIFDEKS